MNFVNNYCGLCEGKEFVLKLYMLLYPHMEEYAEKRRIISIAVINVCDTEGYCQK